MLNFATANIKLHLPWQVKRRKSGAAELVVRVEQLAEQFIELAAEERRLEEVLTRIRSAKSLAISSLAASAVAATEANVHQRLTRKA